MISDNDLAQALFAPRGVALIGASSDPSKTSARPLRYLQKHGYSGAIYPVNPGAQEIAGQPCFADLKSLPGPADQAFIMLPSKAIAAAIRDCAEVGIGCATILSGGFAETGEAGRQRQEALLEVAKSTGVRLLGPNSIGVINTATGLTLSANAMLELPQLQAGRTAVISQSGSIIGALLSHGEARKTGDSKLISVGNDADLTVGEIGALLVDDDETDVILLFLETLRQSERVAAFARSAFDAGKPVIAYTLGRSSVGQELARSHTGALVGSVQAMAAFLEHHGIARVSMFETLIEAPELFRGRHANDTGRPRRAAVVTTTGGGGAMVVDNLGLRQIEVAPAPASVVDRLAAVGIAQDAGHLIDLTMAGARPEVVGGVIGDLMTDAEIDAVVMVVGSSARFAPQLAVDPLLEWAKAPKPFAIYLAPHAETSMDRLATAGMAAFRTPEACADALQALLSWRPPVPVRTPTEPLPLAADLGRDLVVGEIQALGVFSALGIAVAEGEIADSATEAIAAARRLGYPVVLKVASPQISHKSDLGGVEIGIADDEALTAAYRRIMRNVAAAKPEAEITDVLVQKMHQGRAEVLLGLKRDALVGATVVLGLGGVLAELCRDTSLRLAPVTPDQAAAMIEEVVGLAPLRGYRNLPRGDLSALAKAIAAFSQLAGREEVQEAEINPLIVGPQGSGVVAVDGLIVLEQL